MSLLYPMSMQSKYIAMGYRGKLKRESMVDTQKEKNAIKEKSKAVEVYKTIPTQFQACMVSILFKYKSSTLCQSVLKWSTFGCL